MSTEKLQLSSELHQKKKAKLNRTVMWLGIVSLINDIGGEMITAILPMFILSMGGNGIVVGLIGGLRDSVSSLVKVISGYWSDKIGKRKVFVFAGYAVASFFKLILAFSTKWPHILLFACLERVGKGIRTAPRDALVADAMPNAKGKGFGLHRAFDTAGAILGSSLALWIFWEFHWSFKAILILAAAIAFCSLLPLRSVGEHPQTPQHFSLRWGYKHLPEKVKTFIFISGLFAFANFNYMFFILKAQHAFTNSQSVIFPILLYVFFNIFYAIFSIPVGLVSDKIGREWLLKLGYGIFTLTAFGFTWAKSFYSFLVLFALYGIVYAMVEVNQRAYLSDLSDQHLQGTALGTLHTVIGVTALPSGLIAGFLWEELGANAAFVYSGVLSLMTLILFVYHGTGKKNYEINSNARRE